MAVEAYRRSDQKARRTRSFRAGVQSAPAEGRFWPSMYWRRIVIGAPPHGPHKIAWRPQVTLALADTPERRDSREFLLHAPRRDAFEAVHQLGQAHLRRIVDQQVYVVWFAVEFLQHRLRSRCRPIGIFPAGA